MEPEVVVEVVSGGPLYVAVGVSTDDLLVVLQSASIGLAVFLTSVF